MDLLIDSSVWIAASKSTNPVCLKLKKLIKENAPICTIKLIQTEVCQGAKTEKEFHDLLDAFSGFRQIQIQDADWEKSAWNYFRCRKNGITLTTLDCLIGTMANEHRLYLWTTDQIFLKIQPVVGFDLYLD